MLSMTSLSEHESLRWARSLLIQMKWDSQVWIIHPTHKISAYNALRLWVPTLQITQLVHFILPMRQIHNSVRGNHNVKICCLCTV